MNEAVFATIVPSVGSAAYTESKAAEIADLLTFLASVHAGEITGTLVGVFAGQFATRITAGACWR